MNKEEIEELKRLLLQDKLTQYGKRKLIKYLEQKELILNKVTERLKEYLNLIKQERYIWIWYRNKRNFKYYERKIIMNFIFKLIIYAIIAYIAGFIDAFFKDKKINATWIIHFILGYIACSIF